MIRREVPYLYLSLSVIAWSLVGADVALCLQASRMARREIAEHGSRAASPGAMTVSEGSAVKRTPGSVWSSPPGKEGKDISKFMCHKKNVT